MLRNIRQCNTNDLVQKRDRSNLKKKYNCKSGPLYCWGKSLMKHYLCHDRLYTCNILFMNTVECNIRNNLFITNLLRQVKEMNTRAIIELRNEFFLGYLFWIALAELSHGVLHIFRISFIKVVLGMWLILGQVPSALTQNLYQRSFD